MEQKVEEREGVVLENHGEKIFGVLHMPREAENVPAVLICHGLAGHKTGKYRVYVALAKSLAERGVAALRVDFRGSGDSEGEFHEMTLRGVISDALVALEFLSNHDDIDPHRLGIFGRSFGGSVAVLASGQNQNVKSIALWAPVFNADPWRELWEVVQSDSLSDEKKREVMSINGQVPSMHFYSEFFGMDLEEDLEALHTVPVLHIHGEKDELIEISHADEYVKHRKQAHGKTRFIRFPEADHDFSIIEDQVEAIELTTKWFIETLLTRGERWQLFCKKFAGNITPFFQKFYKIFGRSR